MTSIHQLIVNLDRERFAPRQADSAPPRGLRPTSRKLYPLETPNEVLRFAPKSVRLNHQTPEERVVALQAEVSSWRDRAGRAEARLRLIEDRVQRIASECARASTPK